MYYFCTYFDIKYLPKALCLIDSLNRHCPSFKLYALCLDIEAKEQIQNLKQSNIIPLSISDIEDALPILTTIKKDRSKLEYYYTCGPAFIRYVLEIDSDIDFITYLDADLYFFADPAPLFDAFEEYSIGVVAHQLPEFRNKRIWQGIYNVGWINFRRDDQGIKCLELWRDQCIDWCYERHEDGKYADQLYLDKWPQLFTRFHEFNHHGANVAPWNINDYHLSIKNEQIFIDNVHLLFFHFHGLKKISKMIYNTNLGVTLHPPHPIFKKYILGEYLNKLEYFSQKQDPTASIRRYRAKHHFLKTAVRTILGIVLREYVFFKNGRVY